jgi:hypothetical protein
MKLQKPFIGIIAFLVVLLTMPLGHAAVILIETAFGNAYKFHAALLLGFLGILILIAGITARKELPATIYGLFAGLFVWTGWIEFAFMYYANRLGIEPLVINGETVTKPEYLLMPATTGLWAVFMSYYLLGSNTGCRFFIWFQKTFKINQLTELPTTPRNTAITTFMEIILLLWSFYLLLLFAYDDIFAGEKHLITWLILFGTLLWSLILFIKLIRKTNLAYAIRYAIPAVIIFWTFIEIMGRWKVFEEIWINPAGHWPEILGMMVVLVILIVFIIFSKSRNNKNAI